MKRVANGLRPSDSRLYVIHCQPKRSHRAAAARVAVEASETEKFSGEPGRAAAALLIRRGHDRRELRLRERIPDVWTCTHTRQGVS